MRRQFRIRGRSRFAIRGEMREEIEGHVLLAAESLMRHGVEREVALRMARQRFGDFEAAMNTLYESAETREGMMRRKEWWSAIRQDLTLSLRQMRRSPMLAVAVTVTLALGIGANLVVFGIANRLLFSAPTGMVAADELRIVNLPQGGTNPRSPYTNYATLVDLSKAESFASLGAFAYPSMLSLGRGPRAEPVSVNAASASFFATVGVRPVAGRLFLPEEDLPPRGTPVALISSEFWTRKYGRDPTALGATLDINDRLYRIVGVLPPHFTSLDLRPVDIWLTMTDQSHAMNPDYQTDRGSKWMMLVARLKPGVSDERALAEVSRIFTLANREELAPRPGEPANREGVITTAVFNSIIPGESEGTGAEAAQVSLWLVGVAAMVLLIACANVATLLLTRAMRRTAEMAVRLALGVSRSRLVAQLVAESALFALLGGATALLAAYLSRGVIQSVLLPDTDLGPALSMPVVALAIAAITLISVLTSIAPAFQVLRVDLATSLKGASGQFSDGRKRLRATLLVAQVAMSAVLLVGAGLFVRSLENARAKRLGIDMDRVALAEVAIHTSGYDFVRQKQFWATAVRRVRQVPNVENAGLTIGTPLRFSMAGRITIPGVERLPQLATRGPYRNGVDGQFFSTLGSRIIAGRGITDADGESTQRVVVFNETLAKAVVSAGGGNPIGKCVSMWRIDSIPCHIVVGVVEDVTRHGLKEEPSMQYYVPASQWVGQYSLAMVVRAKPGGGEQIIGPVTRAIQEVAGDVPFPRVRTFEQLHDPELRSWKLGATLFTLFGGLAFVVSVVGLYGLLAHSVTQRQREFGIRTALGAQAGDIVRMVLRSGLALVAVGLAIGLAAAAGAAKFVGPMLYKVEPRDMMVYAGSAVLVLLVTAMVSVIPARRASAVLPTVALRGND